MSAADKRGSALRDRPLDSIPGVGEGQQLSASRVGGRRRELPQTPVLSVPAGFLLGVSEARRGKASGVTCPMMPHPAWCWW